MSHDSSPYTAAEMEWLRQRYVAAMESRLLAREVPDLIPATRVITRLMRANSILARNAGELGEQLFDMSIFLSARGDTKMFWVSADMCALVREAARQLPDDCSPYLAVKEPILHAFVVFERPILSWESEDPGLGPVPIGGMAWMWCRSPSWDGALRESLGIVPLGPRYCEIKGLPPLSSSYLFPHASLREHVENRHLRESGVDPMGGPIAVDEMEADENRRLVLALMILMESSVVLAESHLADRPARRRAERAGIPTSVRIVQLRRASSHAERGDHDTDAIEWTHRWIVSGHWRNQACGPELSRRRLTWVSPHIKGPDDKPLVIRPTVRALVR